MHGISSSRRRRHYIVGISVTGFILECGGLLLLLTDEHTNRSNTISTPTPSRSESTLPNRAILDPDGLVVQLPDTRSAIESQLPLEVRSGIFYNTSASVNANPLNDQSMSWISFNAKQARLIRVFVRRDVDPHAAHLDFSGRSEKGADVHINQTSRPIHGYRMDTGRAIKIGSLGDEAFSYTENEHGASEPETDNGERTYNIGGGVVCARYHNVVIEITWEGADYPPTAVKKLPMAGTPLSYSQSRKTTATVIDAIIARLS